MDNFNIPKKAQITDEFKCAKYWPDLKPVSYKFCISRQITKLASGGMQYPDCVECNAGKKIIKHFNGYQAPVKKGKQTNWNTDPKLNAENKKKRIKKGKSPYSSHYAGESQVSPGAPALKLKTEKSFGDNIGMIGGKISEPENNYVIHQTLIDLEFLLKAQVSYLFDLVHEGRLNEAVKCIKLLNEEI